MPKSAPRRGRSRASVTALRNHFAVSGVSSLAQSHPLSVNRENLAQGPERPALVCDNQAAATVLIHERRQVIRVVDGTLVMGLPQSWAAWHLTVASERRGACASM
jgi:hypothetical protein